MHDTSTYTGINCQGFHLAPSVFIVTQISSGLVVVVGAELRLNDDRRVPTPRFTLLLLNGVLFHPPYPAYHGVTLVIRVRHFRIRGSTLAISAASSFRGLTERSLVHLISASACAFTTRQTVAKSFRDCNIIFYVFFTRTASGALAFRYTPE